MIVSNLITIQQTINIHIRIPRIQKNAYSSKLSINITIV